MTAMAPFNDAKKLETNLEVISSLAEPHWADNWNFRAYVQRNIKPAEIDAKAIAIYRDVSAIIDCTSCGNCCKEVYPRMTPDDISRLAKGMGQSTAEVLRLTYKQDDHTVSFCESPCPMLQDNKCTVYSSRPDECREYPHLHKEDFLGGSIGTIENYGTCPIVFNVYARLKHAFAYDPQVDYIGDSDPELTHGSLIQDK